MTEPSEEAALRRILKSQYHASLAMLRDAIVRCPEHLWLDATPTNAFWQLAYHTLFFAHVYVGGDARRFCPWAEHQGDVQHEDAIAGKADGPSAQPLLPNPYTKAQALRYWDFCERYVDGAVDALDLRRTESGFRWYQMSTLEHQFVSIRHIQHHTAQLADRLRAAADIGVAWVGTDKRNA